MFTVCVNEDPSFMMASSIFRVAGHLLGESTSHRWIPLTKDSDAELWCLSLSAPKQTVETTIKTLVIETPSRSLWRHSNDTINRYLWHKCQYDGSTKLYYMLPRAPFNVIAVWGWISNSIPHVTGHVITYPWWVQSYIMLQTTYTYGKGK